MNLLSVFIMLIEGVNKVLKVVVFATFFIFYFFIFSQAQDSKKLESLLKALVSNPKEDSNKVKIFNQLVWEYRNYDFAKAIRYGKQSIHLAREIGYQKGLSEANNFIGIVYRNSGDYPASLRYFYEALKIAEKHKLFQQLGYSYNNIGEIFKIQQKYPQALEYIRKAVETFENLEDKRGIAYAYIRMGEVYQEQKKYDKALEAFEDCLKIRTELKDQSTIESTLVRIGNVYELIGDYEKALLYYEEALAISNKLNDKKSTANTLGDIGNVYLSTGDYTKAIEYATQSFKIARQIGAREFAKDAGKLLTDAYTKINDYKNASTYQSVYAALRDSLVNEENSAKLLLIQKSYELDKKEAEVELLNKDNKIKEIITIALISGLGFVFVLLLALVRINRLKVKSNTLLLNQRNEIEEKNKELEEQKKLIETKNDDITASITYAQRIQQAMLPTMEEIKVSLPESFVFFKPRDIVSGDFYWFSQKEHKSILIAADCTGHGIPGAFMSMIGNDLLNEIINHKDIEEPDKILEELRIGVNAALRQKESKNHDGMDIAVCCIHHSPQAQGLVKGYSKLEFAAAGQDLIYIQNGELNQVRGNNIIIGGYNLLEKETRFTKFVLDISVPTTFYIYSDGYQDQFGGEEKRKFMPRRFRDLLLGIYEQSMDEQLPILSRTIDKWMVGQRQVDDMMVLGVKLEV